jgi:pimeloyl-ACP methyl ester carboxylesterase
MSGQPLKAFPLAVQQQGEGYPILCLHGHPGSADCMKVFTEPLSQQLWTISPDLRGYGRSKTRLPFVMSDHLDDLESLLDRLNIKHCIVLGWSLGGILALELALRQPERIAGLILVATAARPISNVPQPTVPELLYTLVAASLNWLKPGWRWNIETFGKRSILKYLISQHTEEAYRFLARSGSTAVLQTSRHAQQALAVSLKQRYNRLPDLVNLSQPCLVLSGANDRHILSRASQETAQNLKHSHQICYPNVSHLFPWEIPAAMNQDIQAWLQTSAISRLIQESNRIDPADGQPKGAR